MKNSLIFLLAFFFLSCSLPRSTPATGPETDARPPVTSAEDVCLSAEEQKLYDLMMAYRRNNGLPPVPISASLTKVAQLHVRDLEANPPSGRCNMHSWSKTYGDCCYTDDHRNAECMWNKPRELTGYTGNGYEISFLSTAGADAVSALDSWQDSPGHNSVIINRSIWKDSQWKAIGVGIFGSYAVVWFGEAVDPAGRPSNCN